MCVVCSHKLVCKRTVPDTGTRKEMDILEEKFVDGEYSPFVEIGEGCPPNSRRSSSPGMKHDFGMILKCRCDFS